MKMNHKLVLAVLVGLGAGIGLCVVDDVSR